MNPRDKTEDVRVAPEQAVGQAIQDLTAARLGRGFIPLSVLALAGVVQAVRGPGGLGEGLVLGFGALAASVAMLGFGLRVSQLAFGLPERAWMRLAMWVHRRSGRADFSHLRLLRRHRALKDRPMRRVVIVLAIYVAVTAPEVLPATDWAKRRLFALPGLFSDLVRVGLVAGHYRQLGVLAWMYPNVGPRATAPGVASPREG